uniref:LRAT domain-containing protein n=1 Tax=Erpetoichthys calabaricus TaxID=27687 RepID=A0A8C4RLD4_ERPCA
NNTTDFFGLEHFKRSCTDILRPGNEPGVDSKKPGACSVLKQPFSMVKGTSSHKVNNELDQTYSAKNQSKIIEYLEKSIGKKWKYNLADNNCEHFANLARYNQHFSAQVTCNVTNKILSTKALVSSPIKESNPPKRPL